MEVSRDCINSILWTLRKIETCSEEDEELKILATIIMKGWPESKDTVPERVQKYLPFREELSVQDGLIFKEERLQLIIN